MYVEPATIDPSPQATRHRKRADIMRNTLKTIAILSIITFSTLATTGCTEDHDREERVIYRNRDRDDRREWREHRFGQADDAPPLVDSMVLR